MKLFSPEGLVAVSTAGVLLAGCSSPSLESANTEPQVTVSEYALPSEDSKPEITTAPQIPDSELLAPTPSPTPTETSKLKIKNKSVGVVLFDNCGGKDIQQYDEGSLKSDSGFVVKSNIENIVYGKSLKPNTPREAVCKRIPVSVNNILANLVVTVDKKGPTNAFQSFSSTTSETERKPVRYAAFAVSDALAVMDEDTVVMIRCDSENKNLATDPVCADKTLTPQEIAKEMISPSVLRAELKERVVIMTSDKYPLESFSKTVARIDFGLTNKQ